MTRVLLWILGKTGILGLLLIATFLVYAAQYWLSDELQRRREALPDPVELRIQAELRRADADALQREAQALIASRSLVEAQLRELGERTVELETRMADTRAAVEDALAATGHLREQAEQRSRYTRDLWERRTREACTDGPWYRFVDNAARRRACTAARHGRDVALRQLAVWREEQQARVESARDEAARLEHRYREQFETFSRLQPEANAWRSELDRVHDEVRAARERKERLVHAATDLDARADDATRARERLESYMLERWRESWKNLLLLLLALQLLPYLLRTLNYWVLMGVVQREAALRVLPHGLSGEMKTHEAQRTLTVDVEPGSCLRARSSAVRPLTTGVARTRILFQWSKPLVSLAADLVLLTEVEGRATSEGPIRVTLSPSGRDAADRYVTRVDLVDHPGLVVHPRHIVAMLGALDIDSRFRLRSTHAWATGKLRYITLQGTGSVFLEGVGDVRSEPLHDESRHEAAWSVIAFDGRLDYRAWRTELFVPYLLHGQRLVEVQLAGEGHFVWQKCEFSRTRSAGEWFLGSFWSALGRLLGF